MLQPKAALLAASCSLILAACGQSAPGGPAVPSAFSPSARSAAPSLNLDSFALLAPLNVLPTGSKGPAQSRTIAPASAGSKGGSTGPFATQVYDFTYISDPYPGECQVSHPFVPVIVPSTPGSLIVESQALPDICLDTASARALARAEASSQAMYVVAVDKNPTFKGPSLTPLLGPATLANGTLTFPVPNNPYYAIDAGGNKYGFYLAADLDTKDPLPQP